MITTSPAARRKRLPWLLLPLSVFLLVALAACAPALLNPPRESAELPPAPPTPEPMVLRAPTPTGEPYLGQATVPLGEGNPTLTLWVEKPNARYEGALRELINAFTARHQISVELVTVPPELLPDLVTSAATTTTFDLPDVVLAPLEYIPGWEEQGILDAEAATALLEELGPETFDQEAVQIVSSGGQAAALPSDGWQQLLLYREDWFDEKGIPAPTDFEAMLTAAEVISDRANLIYSFNMPTESSLAATTRAFEQMAIANGCQLIDDKGELHILDDVCRDALDYYRFLCNGYCPPGVQTEVSALNAYLAGRAGFIVATPWALPAIAGLDDDYRPSCPDCTRAGYLAENTGLVTTIEGRGAQASPQNLGVITYLGITTVANADAAATFARFWLDEGYVDWLAIEPARKVPMRLGTPDEPQRFLEAWFNLPLAGSDESIADLFGREFAETLATDVVNPQRWGYTQGGGPLITTLFEDLTLSILLQELLSGYYDADRAAIEGYKRMVELIPDYEYYFDPEPTPENP